MVDKLFIPYEKTFGDRFKQGRVARIEAKEKKVMPYKIGISIDMMYVLIIESIKTFARKSIRTSQYAFRRCSDLGRVPHVSIFDNFFIL